MPVVEGRYQCRLCEDVFEAVSGSFSKCKCGESEIEPSSFGYSYRNGNSVDTVERIKYYLKEEFVTFPEDIQTIYNEIKGIVETNGYKYYLHEMKDSGKNGEEFLSQIILTYGEFVREYSSEQNEIRLSVSLSKEDYKGDEITKKRLSRFLNLMRSIEAGEFDVAKRTKMYDLAEQENIYFREEPTGETNVTFYF
jgi:hypothetical protein